MTIRRALVFACFVSLQLVFSRGAWAVTVSPMVKDVFVQPGETVVYTMTVSNESGVVKSYSVTPHALYYDQELRSIDIREGGLDSSEFTIQPKEFVLAAGDKQEVVLTATGVSQGTYGIEVLENESSGGGIQVQEGVMALLFVNPEIGTSSAAVMNVFCEESLLFTSDSCEVVLRNTGEVVMKPDAYISARDVFGIEIAQYEINGYGKRIFPGESRVFTAERQLNGLYSSFVFGPVTYRVMLNDGSEFIPMYEMRGKGMFGWVSLAVMLSAFIIGGVTFRKRLAHVRYKGV